MIKSFCRIFFMPDKKQHKVIKELKIMPAFRTNKEIVSKKILKRRLIGYLLRKVK